MKKIMFNDKYGLTQAVLEGRKTMTRRIVPQSVVDYYTYEAEDPTIIDAAKYDIGDVVAVAQNLKDMGYDARDTKTISGAIWGLDHTPAWTNKMFVTASMCVHHIRITDIKVERLQEISDEECLKEGIYANNAFEAGYGIDWVYEFKNAEVCFMTPREAFAALIDKVSGKGTWERNPWVFVYEFELVEE